MKKKYAIFTIIVGGYDNVKQPLFVDDRFDYIIFSDTPIKKPGIWEVRSVKYESNKQWLKARYPRLNTAVVLPEYEASLYIDGNIQITSRWVYDRCMQLYDDGIEWASIKHQGRKGIYGEINAIIGLGWVHDYDVLDWYKYMRDNGFDDCNGLYENNIIFRKHTNNVNKVNTIWWWSIEHFSFRRDQFALMYAIWRVPEIKTGYFLPENENAWDNNGYFICENHNPHKRILDKTLWEKLRDRYVRKFYKSGGWEIYYTQWFDKLIKYPCPCLIMHLWTMYILIKYDVGFLIKREWNKLKGRIIKINKK